MKNLLKKLPALALAIVAVAAFAFNMPQQNAEPLYANHPTQGKIEVTDWEMGTDYLCNPGAQCTYRENGQTVGIGTFVPLR